MRGLCAAVLLAIALPVVAADGVKLGEPSAMRNLVPAGALEKQAADQYGELKRKAAEKEALAPDDHPQVKRLRAIAKRMIPFAGRFNPRAGQWQ